MQASIIVLVILYLAVAALLGRWADRRLAAHERLPMQWGVGGRTNWSAPRRLALVVTPLLSGIGLLAAAVLIGFSSGEPNVSDGEILRLLASLGVVGIAVYAGWLALVMRWARAQT